MIEALLGKKKADKLYVDDVFSSYLYTGNGATQTINNGIDLAGEGGLAWLKPRTNNGNGSHVLVDSVRGVGLALFTNQADAQSNQPSTLTSFLSDGFLLGSSGLTNTTSNNFVSWTFRRAKKFFDIVTYTGNGVAERQIAHGLGVAPGMITGKSTSVTGDWSVYHRSASGDLKLNLTNAQTGSRTLITAATESTFTVSGAANINGAQYVAYLWAHDPSEDGIIQCGAYSGNGATVGPVIELGWEPQYVLLKGVNAAGTVGSGGNWRIMDAMRGLPPAGEGQPSPGLNANDASSEEMGQYLGINATGFQLRGTGYNNSSGNYIYLAIRRPNKPPKSGAEVYSAIARSGTGAANHVVTGMPFAPDVLLQQSRASAWAPSATDRLRGVSTGGGLYLVTSSNAAEQGSGVGYGVTAINMSSIKLGSNDGGAGGLNASGITYVDWAFRRAPGFLDVVCDTGTGAARSVAHSLAVAPELLICKRRSLAEDWYVWHRHLGVGKFLRLNTTATPTVASGRFDILPDMQHFYLGQTISSAAQTYVSYLFASLPGISKVGNYTGNGTAQVIDCGFATGARFILIKRIDAAGDWMVADSSRGLVSGNDPMLKLNSTAAEITSLDWVDPDPSGFVINQEPTGNANVSGGSYVFLAIS